MNAVVKPMKWAEVLENPEVQKLSNDELEEVRNQYFRDVVAPRYSAGELENVRKEFDQDTGFSHVGRSVKRAVVNPVVSMVSRGLEGGASEAPEAEPVAQREGAKPMPAGPLAGGELGKVFSYLNDLGYKPHEAAGIMGNLFQESGFKTGARSKDGFGSYGLAQWTGNRKQALMDFARANGKDPGDIYAQLDFLDYELNGPESAARQALAKTASADEAARVFSETFERPNKNAANNERRAGFAQSLMKLLAGSPDWRDEAPLEAWLTPQQQSGMSQARYGLPVTPQFEAKTHAIYDQATPEIRREMIERDDAIGRLARDWAGVSGEAANLGLDVTGGGLPHLTSPKDAMQALERGVGKVASTIPEDNSIRPLGRRFPSPKLVGNTLEEIRRGLGDLIPYTKGSIANLVEGAHPLDENTAMDRWAEAANALQQARTADALDVEDPTLFGDRGTWRQTFASIPFSGVSLAGSLASRAAGALGGGLVAGPPGAVAGGIAGGFGGGLAAPYRMDASMFMRQALDKFKNTYREQNGRNPSREELKDVQDSMQSYATEHGLWEAGLESAGNLILAKLFEPLLSRGGKSLIAKAAKAVAGSLAEEMTTETLTQQGQQIVESKAGLDENPPRSWTNLSDLGQSASEVAGPVALQVLLMGGLGAVANQAAPRGALTDEQWSNKYDRLKGELTKKGALPSQNIHGKRDRQDEQAVVGEVGPDNRTVGATAVAGGGSGGPGSAGGAAAGANNRGGIGEVSNRLPDQPSTNTRENGQPGVPAVVDGPLKAPEKTYAVKWGSGTREFTEQGLKDKIEEFVTLSGNEQAPAKLRDSAAKGAAFLDDYRVNTLGLPALLPGTKVKEKSEDERVSTTTRKNRGTRKGSVASGNGNQSPVAHGGAGATEAAGMGAGEAGTGETLGGFAGNQPVAPTGAGLSGGGNANEDVALEENGRAKRAGGATVGGAVQVGNESASLQPAMPSTVQEGGSLGVTDEKTDRAPPPNQSGKNGKDSGGADALDSGNAIAGVGASTVGATGPSPLQNNASTIVGASGGTPGQTQTPAIDQAAHEAATSPTNGHPQPTDKQKKAGNYKKGHVSVAGLDVSIENPAGSVRSGTDANGKPWKVRMNDHYGYIKGTVGRDKDHIDVFIRPGTPENYNGSVYVIDQKKGNGHFDEHKVMLGYSSPKLAERAYRRNYAKGWTGLKAMTPLSMDEFKAWLNSGKTTQPITEFKGAQNEQAGQPNGGVGVANESGAKPGTVEETAGGTGVQAGQAGGEGGKGKAKGEIKKVVYKPDLSIKDMKVGMRFSGGKAGQGQKGIHGGVITALGRTRIRYKTDYMGREVDSEVSWKDLAGVVTIKKGDTLYTTDEYAANRANEKLNKDAQNEVKNAQQKQETSEVHGGGGAQSGIRQTGGNPAGGGAGVQPGEPGEAEGKNETEKSGLKTPPATAFKPTHELPDGTQVVAVEGENNVWRDENGAEYEDEDATRIEAGQAVGAANVGATGPSPIQEPAAQTGEASGGFGKDNKIFTEDAAAKARALLKSKLGQLNTGLDPEMIQAGITLAGYYIEGGARSFADYTKAMVADLGEAARPYLRSWYEGVRYYPGFDAAGMSSASEIEEQRDLGLKAPPTENEETAIGRSGVLQDNKQDANKYWVVPPQPDADSGKVTSAEYQVRGMSNERESSILASFELNQQNKPVDVKIYHDWAKKTVDAAIQKYLEESKSSQSELESDKKAGIHGAQSPRYRLALELERLLKSGDRISAKDLQQATDKAFGGTQAEGKYSPKDAYDAMEAAVNLWIMRENPFRADGEQALSKVVNAASKLTEMVGRLPTQTRRDQEMDEFQQFSTPPALAYVANWVANVNADDTMMEPSAGTGDLAAWSRNAGARLILNELSPRRAELLKELFPGARVFTENAEQLDNVLPAGAVPSVVVMNPPFSSTAGRVQGQRDTMNGARHIEQALNRLADNGRLVAIVGQGMAADRPAFKEWWKKIEGRYNVRANIGISGKEYAKYGTTFDNQILVIDKTGPTDGPVITGRVESVTELPALLEGVRNDRPEIDAKSLKPASGASADANGVETGGPEQPAGGATASVGAGQAGTATRPGRGGGTAEAVGAGSDSANEAVDHDGQRGPAESETAGESAGGGGGVVDGTAGQSEGGVNPTVGATSPSPLQDKTPEQAEAAPNSGLETPPTSELSLAVFSPYQPQKLKIPGAKAHPGALVQSSAMAAVEPPAPTYKPNLPKEVISDGLLSVAQLEAVTYAGQAHQEFLPNGSRRGFFIGDGTGVGKGREIAGIILDNQRQGRKKAVWVSFNEGLINDAQRDFSGVGGDDKQIFWLGKVKPGNDVLQPEGILFTTYYTLRGGEKKQANDQGQQAGQSRLDQIVKWLGKDFDGVVVFDEAHSMGNVIAIKGKRGVKKPSQQAIAGVNLQRALPKARIVYVSATGATEVSNLGYADRLGLWGEGTPFPNVATFIDQVTRGGVAAMELISRDMKALGMYTARSLSYDGVTYQRLEHELTPLQRDIYNELARAWQGVLRNVHAALALTGGGKNGNAKSAAMAAFWGSHQSFFNRVITSLQTPTVIDDMRKQIDAGNAVVIQLVSTNEATQDREVAKAAAEGIELEELDFTPRQILMEYVRNSFPVAAFEETMDANGNLIYTAVVDSNGNPVFDRQAVAMRDELLKNLEQIRVPENPIDAIIAAFGSDKVGEVTGRKRRFVPVRDEHGNLKLAEEKRGKHAAQNDAKAFQDDRKPILVFSQAGGTGFSFHADNTAVNQRKRIHYILQPGWRADSAVQGFGRTHRTNQRQPPHYVLPTTNLKAQKRFVSSIARRLDQLGALTRGQRQATSQGLFSATDNLESQYATDALKALFIEMYHGRSTLDFSETTQALGLDGMIDRKTGAFVESKIPTIPQFLNRLLSLDVGQQDRVFSAFEQRMNEIVERAIQSGHYDGGMETLKAESVKKVRDDVAYTDERTGATTRYVELDVERKVDYLDWKQVSKAAKNRGEEFVGWFKGTHGALDGQLFGLVDLGVQLDADGQAKERGLIMTSRRDQWRYIENVGEYKKGEKVKKVPPTYSGMAWTEEKTKISEPVSDREAPKLWTEQVEAAPKTEVSRERMVVGVILPVWDRITGSEKILRLQTDSGEQMIGRPLGQKAAKQTLKNLGLDSEVSKLAPEELWKRIDGGERAVLANGWSLNSVRVSNERRVEIKSPHNYFTAAEVSQLQEQGAFVERINWEDRAFIPVGPGGLEVFKRVTSGRPVVDLFGGTSDEGVRYSKAAPGSWYYSELLHQVGQVRTEKAPARQWKAIIAGLRQKGVKQEEIEWTGVNEWLDLQRETVTREQVAAYLEGNGVRVEEVFKGALGGGNYSLSDIWQGRIEFDDESGQWEVYQPGYGDPTGVGETEQDAINDAAQSLGVVSNTKYGRYQEPGGENYREVLLTLPIDATDSEFASSHYDESNILAHVRANDRVDANGKRVMFLEELQSDWGQEGRQKGFANELTPKQKEMLAAGIPLQNIKGGGVPSAPFVTDTKAWVALALKRVIADAAEQGYDRVAWTTGAQQADRYSLRRQVESIVVSLSGGARSVVVKPKEGQAISFAVDEKGIVEEPAGPSQVNLSGKRLDEVVGKEMAERIMKAEKATEFKEEGLEIGGQGMKQFYDRIVPQVANELLRKFGGGRVAPVEIPGLGKQPGFEVTPELRERAAGGLPLFKRGQSRLQAAPTGGMTAAAVKDAIRREFGAGMGRMLDSGRVVVVPDMAHARAWIERRHERDVGASGGRPNNTVDVRASTARPHGDGVGASGGRPSQDNLLDWEKPFASQPEAVKAAIRQWWKSEGLKGTPETHLPMKEETPGIMAFSFMSSKLGGDDQARAALRALGVEGVSEAGDGAATVNRFDQPHEPANERIQGAYVPGKQGKKGVVVLVADQLTPGTLRGVVGHELFHAAVAEDAALARRIEVLKRDIQALRSFGEHNPNTELGRWVSKANRRVRWAGALPEHEWEEFAAYAISEYERSPASLPTRIAKWVRDLLATIRTALFRAGVIGLRNLAPADLAAIGRHWLRMAGDGQRGASAGRPYAVGKAPAMASRAKGDGDVGASGGRPDVRDAQGRLLAPNGKPSKLNAVQWRQVRTPEFKKWFGDWENDPANASKVVDENGEPLVVYHGTRYDFSKFDPEFSSDGSLGKGIYAGTSPQIASIFAEKKAGSNIMPVYMKIVSPATLMDRAKIGTERQDLIKVGFDGVVGDHEYVAFQPYQIKSATGNTGAFSPTNPDIRYSKKAPVDPFDPNVAPVVAERLDELTWNQTKELPRQMIQGMRALNLNLLGMQQLAQVYENDLPGIKPFVKLMQKFTADPFRQKTEAAELARKWGRLKREDSDLLADVMHVSTVNDVDASRTEYEPRYWTDEDIAKDFYSDIHDLWGVYIQKRAKIKSTKGNVEERDRQEFEDAWKGLVNLTRIPLMTREKGAKGLDRMAQDYMRKRILPNWEEDKRVQASLRRRIRAEKRREQARERQWRVLREQWNQLSPQARTIYQSSKEGYQRHWENVEKALIERIERQDIPVKAKRDTIDKLRLLFRRQVPEVYFPLHRDGPYVVVVKKLTVPAGGGLPASYRNAAVMREQTLARAERLRDELKAKYEPLGYEVQPVFKQPETTAREQVSGRFVSEVLNLMGEAGGGRRMEELRETVLQMYLQQLPDLSWAKHEIHRKKIPGYSRDARRAWAHHMAHGANHLARIRYVDRLEKALDDMQTLINDNRHEEAFDAVKAQEVLDSLKKRLDFALNPRNNPLTDKLTSFGFVLYLGLSPASAITNLMQVPMIAGPVIGARYGMAKATAELTWASGTIGWALRGFLPDEQTVLDRLKKNLSADEYEAIERSVLEGYATVTLAHDLSGVAQGKERGEQGEAVMRVMGAMFHQAELFNRLTTILAAYRLGRKAGLTSEQSFDDAVELDYYANFDYSAANRPPVMQGPWTRVITQFKQYAQNVTYLWGRNGVETLLAANDFMHGRPVAERRREAVRLMGGLMATHALAAGVLGLPLVTSILAAISMLFKDEDEPWDAQMALRNWLADNTHSRLAESVLHGAARALRPHGGGEWWEAAPGDISSRVGLDHLWFPDLQEGLEPVDWYKDLAVSLLGPVVGYGLNVARGVQAWSENGWRRGLEDMSPKVLKDLLKAWRYAEEGVVDKSGVTVLDELTWGEIASQVAGFTPARVKEAYEQRGAIYSVDRALERRHEELLSRLAKRRMEGEPMRSLLNDEEVKAFNDKNPQWRITGKSLVQSVKGRRRRIEQAEDGVYLPRKRQAEREAGRFFEK